MTTTCHITEQKGLVRFDQQKKKKKSVLGSCSNYCCCIITLNLDA
jgi:hypothetical protein